MSTATRPPRTLRSRAIALLARREYSRAELRQRLLARRDAVAPEVDEVEALLDALTSEGLLSDTRYAQALVRRKQGAYSQRAIAESLKAQGVGHEAIATALAEHETDDHAALVALWRRRFGQPPRDERDKARQVRFLQSRGFGLASILRLLRSPPTDVDAD